MTDCTPQSQRYMGNNGAIGRYDIVAATTSFFDDLNIDVPVVDNFTTLSGLNNTLVIEVIPPKIRGVRK